MARQKHYSIRLEEPPASRRGKSRAGKGALADLIKRLGNDHPGEWALLDRKKKNIGYLYNMKKKNPRLNITTRKNADGTFGVWIKVGKNKRHITQTEVTQTEEVTAF